MEKDLNSFENQEELTPSENREQSVSKTLWSLLMNLLCI